MQDPLPVVDAGFYPTPLHELVRLSDHLGGARIWAKRDDLTGLAFGGSKTRSLGALLGKALADGADTVITCGPTTSNHVRLTAAAANRFGLDVVLVLKRGHDESIAQGNMLLNQMLGARLVFVEVGKLHELEPLMQREAEALRAAGRKPWVIPGGGYSPIGALGYRGLVQELRDQSEAAGFKIDAVVFASGSGCIQSGLLAGAMLEQTSLPVIGITINRSIAELVPRIVHDVHEALKLRGIDYHPSQEDIRVLDDYMGPGYAIPSDEGMDAIKLLARTEGLMLDPCYTSKSMAAAIDLAQREFRKGQNIVYIHTGGTPGIFTYSRQLNETLTSTPL